MGGMSLSLCVCVSADRDGPGGHERRGGIVPREAPNQLHAVVRRGARAVCVAKDGIVPLVKTKLQNKKTKTERNKNGERQDYSGDEEAIDRTC